MLEFGRIRRWVGLRHDGMGWDGMDKSEGVGVSFMLGWTCPARGFAAKTC